MTKFNFRLQKVLDFRRIEEENAKTEFLEARARRIDAEHDLQYIQQTRSASLQVKSPSLESRTAMQAYLCRLEDQVRAQSSIIGILTDEEEKSKSAWIESRKAAEALQTLRDNEYELYQKESARLEQAELDEWAVLRRAA